MGARRAVDRRGTELLDRVRTIVRQSRATLGLTQEQLAERSGLSIGAVNRIESGSRLPSLETLEQIAQGLDTTLVDLLARASSARTANSGTTRATTARKVALLLEAQPEQLQRLALELVRVLVRNPPSEDRERTRRRR
jgi:transcriptional regulator with XRE-family HTH domain